MQIRTKLFANIASYAPHGGLAGKPFDLDLPAGASLADLVQRLKLPPDLVKITFVNGLVQDLDYVLKPGDEVGIFPPIGGG